MLLSGIDTQLQQAAFDYLRRLASVRGGVLDSADLAGGFEFRGDPIPLVNPQRGIFKPRQMAGLLSIRTVVPRRGGRIWYDDRRDAHRQIYGGDELASCLCGDPAIDLHRRGTKMLATSEPSLCF